MPYFTLIYQLSKRPHAFHVIINECIWHRWFSASSQHYQNKFLLSFVAFIVRWQLKVLINGVIGIKKLILFLTAPFCIDSPRNPFTTFHIEKFYVIIHFQGYLKQQQINQFSFSAIQHPFLSQRVHAGIRPPSLYSPPALMTIPCWTVSRPQHWIQQTIPIDYFCNQFGYVLSIDRYLHRCSSFANRTCLRSKQRETEGREMECLCILRLQSGNCATFLPLALYQWC